MYFLLNLIMVSGSFCPTQISCTYYDNRNKCAYIENDRVYLNNYQCPSTGHFCKLSDIMATFRTVNTTSNVYCSDVSDSQESIERIAEDLVANEEAYQLKRLVDGHLKICEDDSDCLLEDGTYGECFCTSAYPNAYCGLNYGDPAMAPIFELAKQGEYTKLSYYLAYQQAFVPMIKPVGCFKNIHEQVFYNSALYNVTTDHSTLTK